MDRSTSSLRISEAKASEAGLTDFAAGVFTSSAPLILQTRGGEFLA